MNIDKASREYWDRTYTGDGVPRAVFDPHRGGIRHFGKRIKHEYFLRAFSDRLTRDMRLLEIGCGGSRMLPYFAREFGFNISGLDYSEPGCEMARRVLVEEGVEGDIFEGNLFDAWPDRAETYDVVVTFGVVEHFVDMAGCITAMSRFLRPGGMMITVVPNLCGFIGSAQQRLCRPVYLKHNVVTVESLKAAHEGSGLSAVSCEYVGFVNFGVVNLNEVRPGSVEWHVKNGVLTALRALTALTWTFELHVCRMPPNRLTSPYVVCRAVK